MRLTELVSIVSPLHNTLSTTSEIKYSSLAKIRAGAAGNPGIGVEPAVWHYLTHLPGLLEVDGQDDVSVLPYGY